MRTAALPLMISMAITMIAASTASAEIAWQSNLRAAHAQAQSEGKLLLLHFYSDNCTWCERLEQGSFKAPQVGDISSMLHVKWGADSEGSPLKISRGLNALWNTGGIMYAPPIR